MGPRIIPSSASAPGGYKPLKVLCTACHHHVAVSHILGHLKSPAFRVFPQISPPPPQCWEGNVCLEPNHLQATRWCIRDYQSVLPSVLGCSNALSQFAQDFSGFLKSGRYWAKVSFTCFTDFNIYPFHIHICHRSFMWITQLVLLFFL